MRKFVNIQACHFASIWWQDIHKPVRRHAARLRGELERALASKRNGRGGNFMTLFEAPLDLGDPSALALLRRLDARWGDMDPAARAAALAGLELVVPPPPVPGGPLLMPGGSLALGRPLGDGGLLVCDPEGALVLPQEAAASLRMALEGRAGCATLLHRGDGPACLGGGPPDDLPPQAATLVPAGTLPAFPDTPAVVRWHAGGAAAWPLAPAPGLLALAAGLAAVPLGGPGLGARIDAPGAEAAFARLSPALAAHLDDLLALDLSDALRWALTGLCTDGRASLANRMAEVLPVLPAVLLPDPEALPGAPGAGWEAALPELRTGGAVLLGVEAPAQPRRAVFALRAVLAEAPARLLRGEEEIALGSDLALFAAPQAAACGRLMVLLAPPAGGPVALYALAREAAQRAGAAVLAAAPCWGFRHSIRADGSEAGNAAWFGMGAALDELDLVCPDAF
jgi:hypothetical protein